MEIIEETPYRYRIEREAPMRVPGIVFASRALLPDAKADKSLEQVRNVATLPGIVRASYAMPDVHWGYGFPIGGVAATDVDAGGVVSPGGVGFDISCGVRLLAAAGLDREALSPVLQQVMDGLDRATPRGMGRGAVWHLHGLEELERVLLGGSRYAGERGHGVARDLRRCEDFGAVPDADPGQVSERAMEPPRRTTPGPTANCSARPHGGSSSRPPARRWTWSTTSPITSPRSRRTPSTTRSADSASTKGRDPGPAARTPGPAARPPRGRPAGAHSGTMGTSSYVLAGIPGGEAMNSTCHGAGRRQSRHQAARGVSGRQLRADLEARGIAVRGASWRGLAEEARTSRRSWRWPSRPGCAARSRGSCRWGS